MIITGNDLENAIEQALIDNNMPYDREGEQNAYGRKAGKGKYDFLVHGITAIECKVKDKQEKVTIPGLSKRTKKPIKQPMIKSHQLKALRKTSEELGKDTYVFAHITEENQSYVISEREIRDLVARDMWKRNLKNEMTPTTIQEFIAKLGE